jgi:hypothetical protein
VKYQKNDLVIHSGGQTGVDRAALDFALCNGISCTGWCPYMRMAEDGIINLRYPLRQCYSTNADVRTELNVVDCDATLIIVYDDMDHGTQLTFELAHLYRKPVFVWIISRNNAPEVFHKWLQRNNIQHINIAGPRESNAPGIYNHTLELLEKLFYQYL